MAKTLQIDLPHRTRPGRDAFDSTPQHLRNWLANLPMANVEEATKRLCTALVDLNGQDLDNAQRFRALELMMPAVEHAAGEMKKYFAGKTLPLSGSQARFAERAHQLITELTTGYKIIAVEQANTGVLHQNKNLLGNSLYRAMEWLDFVLLLSYQTYMSYPKGLWSELNRLYAYAYFHKLSTQPIQIAARDGGTTENIDDLYKQILLLALACPYRLRHGVADRVARVLRVWAVRCRIGPAGVLSDALFVVDPDGDQPPTYRILNQAQNQAHHFALETSRLAEDVRTALTELRNTGKSPYKLSSGTLRRLMLAWGVMPRRRFSRTRDHAQIVAATGLSAVHYFLSGEAAFNNTTGMTPFPGFPSQQPTAQHRQASGIREIDPERRSRRRATDQQEFDYRLEGQARPSETEEAVARAAAGMRIDRSFQTQSWKMVNVSAGGYCLLWDNPETTRAQVGELIGIREQNDPDTFHWRLGIIRWLKNVRKRGLELGIQMLAPGAVAINARPENCATGSDCSTRGLLLPEVASIQLQSSLLLPSPPFLLGNTALVSVNGKELRVKLTKLVENTGSFAQFQFVTLSESLQPEPGPDSHRSAELRSPDDIWDIL
jgi:hypothetical protein